MVAGVRFMVTVVGERTRVGPEARGEGCSACGSAFVDWCTAIVGGSSSSHPHARDERTAGVLIVARDEQLAVWQDANR